MEHRFVKSVIMEQLKRGREMNKTYGKEGQTCKYYHMFCNRPDHTTASDKQYKNE